MRRLVAMVALLTGACSPGDPSHPGADAAVAEGGSSGCFFNCADASFDGPLVLQVKTELGYTCGQSDGCHGASAGMMLILPGAEFAQLIDAQSYEMPSMVRVAPGDPLGSYLYLKLRCEGGIEGGCMPGGKPDPRLAQLFHDWIEAGAPTE